MKNLLFGALALLFCVSNQAQSTARYTQEAPEIEVIKTYVEAYNQGDWKAMRALYADKAEVHHNSQEPITPDAVMEKMIGMK